MEQSKLDRINELARKAKAEGLTPREEQEREGLRNEYRAAMRRNLQQQLDSIYIMDEHGNQRKLGKKKTDTNH